MVTSTDRYAQSIWIGYDPREALGFAVARHSIRKLDRVIPVRGIVLDELKQRGWYWRETERRTNSDGRQQLWDVISDAPMATEFSIARFLVKHLARTGWALFVDSDVMFRQNPARLFDLVRHDKAVMVVKHDHNPTSETKMDGQVQTVYSRKNWSSVMLINCDHSANAALSLELINTVPGRDLHRFCWLPDELIGELPQQWNYLVGHSKLPQEVEPSVVHFTSGLPDMAGFERQEYADEWRSMRAPAVGAI